MESRFTHLHTHSHYSLLNALPKIPELVTAAVANKMTALALTDSGNLYGGVEFYKACNTAEIKPVLGVDFYVALRTRHDKESGIDNRRSRLVLLAKDIHGYRDLIKMVTKSHLEGFYYKPRIDHEVMKQHGQNLICILPSFSSEVTSAMRSKDKKRGMELLDLYKETFGKDDVFIEITHHPEIDGHEALMKDLIALARKTDTQIVAAHDTYYIDPEDRSARETLLSVQSMNGYRGRGGLTNDEEDFSFISSDKAEELFKDTPDALENVGRIVDMCNVEMSLGNWLFPEFELPEGITADERLRRIVETGLERREMKDTPDVRERIEYELKTICDKGYASYFLVVGDLMKYAHEHDILTTIRGSVAGSLVTYLAGITNIDPLEYELPFERFLNPDRPSAPDIDMDFADNRRDEVIAYARKKYGNANVAQIGTFGTMMARGAVRDTTRALGYDYSLGDKIAKLIPFGAQGFPMTLDRALDEEPEFKKLYDTDEEVQAIVDMAKKIEGCARHISVHAAGVVISPVPLSEIVPIQFDTKGEEKIITQYDMHSVEDAGLIKFDFLGLKNLAVLSDAIKRVKKLLDVDVDIEDIDLEDHKTFEMLARGETVGTFQLNGAGMTEFLKQLEPSSINDINVMVALYRPGPMKNIPEYIARKNGESAVTYHHPKMEEFLEKSYGILVYQEDIMLTAINIAGYTWKNVDKLRKAIGKKIPEEMARQHDIFVNGCMKHSEMTKTDAEGLWDLFEPFQGYGFNKAHAASYGRVAYQTAYMKSNFPVIYMASLLTADAGNIDKISEIITECTRMCIDMLPPDVNESLGDFTVVFDKHEDPHNIRFGLHSIKNFGNGVADAIIAERKQNGEFTSLEDFLTRVHSKSLNKKSLESLIKCGAMDRFGERAIMLENLVDLCDYNKQSHDIPENQDSLFGLMEDHGTLPKLALRSADPESPEERLRWEKELLGLYISGHPLDLHSDKLQNYDFDISRAKEELQPGMKTILVGVVEESKSIMTRGGERMAFVRISDQTGSLEVVVFPKVYALCSDALEPEGCVKVKGLLSDRGGRLSILADAVKKL